MKDWLLPFLLALGTGTLSAWGVGGGTLLLVCMTLFLGVEHRLAQTINLLFFLPAAAAGLMFHVKTGYLDRQVWRQAALPGAAAALVGSALALLVDVSVLEKPFGIFLLCSGASMLLGSRGEK